MQTAIVYLLDNPVLQQRRREREDNVELLVARGVPPTYLPTPIYTPARAGASYRKERWRFQSRKLMIHRRNHY